MEDGCLTAGDPVLVEDLEEVQMPELATVGRARQAPGGSGIPVLTYKARTGVGGTFRVSSEHHLGRPLTPPGPISPY